MTLIHIRFEKKQNITSLNFSFVVSFSSRFVIPIHSNVQIIVEIGQIFVIVENAHLPNGIMQSN